MTQQRKNTARRLRTEQGFTLLEVLVVVVIIGVLAALIVPNILSRPAQARETAARSDIGAISSALQLYRLDNIQYPTQAQGIEALVSRPGGLSTWREGGYLAKMPIDPWGNPYQYQYPGTKNAGSFDLFTYGADGQPGGEGENADIGNW